MKKSTAALASVATAAVILTGGATSAVAMHKDVTVTVDGQEQQVSGYGTTVASVLVASGVKLNTRDVVEPSLNSSVSSGDTITVQYNKPVILDIDGTEVTFYTTATTVADALEDLGRDDLESAELSVSRDMALPREGLSFDVTTPKTVSLAYAGEKAEDIDTTSATVGDLLEEQDITVDSDDRVSPDADTEITADLEITVDVVSVTTKKKTESIDHEVKSTKDSSIDKGTTEVKTEGEDGSAVRTYKVTTINGKVADKTQIDEKVTKEPVTEVRLVGTKETTDTDSSTTSSSGTGINLARASMWDTIAQCESTGNWSINTGNGYYGGLQFSKSTWDSVNGTDFAAYPHQASRAEQITVANRLYAQVGTSAWGCA